MKKLIFSGLILLSAFFALKSLGEQIETSQEEIASILEKAEDKDLDIMEALTQQAFEILQCRLYLNLAQHPEILNLNLESVMRQIRSLEPKINNRTASDMERANYMALLSIPSLSHSNIQNCGTCFEQLKMIKQEKEKRKNTTPKTNN